MKFMMRVKVKVRMRVEFCLPSLLNAAQSVSHQGLRRVRIGFRLGFVLGFD